MLSAAGSVFEDFGLAHGRCVKLPPSFSIILPLATSFSAHFQVPFPLVSSNFLFASERPQVKALSHLLASPTRLELCKWKGHCLSLRGRARETRKSTKLMHLALSWEDLNPRTSFFFKFNCNGFHLSRMASAFCPNSSSRVWEGWRPRYTRQDGRCDDRRANHPPRETEPSPLGEQICACARSRGPVTARSRGGPGREARFSKRAQTFPQPAHRRCRLRQGRGRHPQTLRFLVARASSPLQPRRPLERPARRRARLPTRMQS